MKTGALLLSLAALAGTTSCDSPTAPQSAASATAHPKPVVAATAVEPSSAPVDRAAILKNFATWYKYFYYTIKLSQDFAGLDADSALISRQAFLTQLSTGRFVPFRQPGRQPVPVYRLYPLKTDNTDIVSTIRQSAETALDYTRMEGRQIPAFTFTDLQGKCYTSKSTKGKLLVIKCWFIGCVACVKEFPQLNRLTQDYATRKDILFVSLALDQEKPLLAFLKRRPFNYAVVARQQPYIQQSLKVNSFPTHILVDRQGVIVKVAGSVDDLAPALVRQAQTSL